MISVAWLEAVRMFLVTGPDPLFKVTYRATVNHLEESNSRSGIWYLLFSVVPLRLRPSDLRIRAVISVQFSLNSYIQLKRLNNRYLCKYNQIFYIYIKLTSLQLMDYCKFSVIQFSHGIH